MHTDRCGNTCRQKCCAKGRGKKLKYKSLCKEIQRMWNMKCTIVPVIIGATGIVTRSLRKNLETVPGKHSIDSLQKTAILGISHIMRKVLQCEAWSLQHAATIPNWYSEINVTFYSVTLARTIWLPDDGPRTEICRSVFTVLMCKFYKFYIYAVVIIIIE